MNLNRTIVVLVALITGIFLAAAGSFAAKGGNGGGKPPSEPPQACADTFPAFAYVTQPKRAPEEIHLSSSDGCRTEFLAVAHGSGWSMKMHMAEDRSKGVVVWVEDPGALNQKIVRRLDFTIDASGNVVAEQPATILPLAGEEPLPGEQLYYTVGGLWGDEDHASLYVVVSRLQQFNSGNETEDLMIYDLNDLTDVSAVPAPPAPDVRATYHRFGPIIIGSDDDWDWDWLDATGPSTLAECRGALYPQFIPTCYKYPDVSQFNASGTRLYFSTGFRGELQDSEVELWHATMRMDIDKETVGPDLGQWIISGPNLVAVVDFRGSGGPESLDPRPAAAPDTYTLPDPEIVGRLNTFLNADICAAQYAPFANGNTLLPDDFWLACIDTSLVGHTGFGNGQVWESADTYLFDRNGKPRSGGEIYRMTITGPSAGTEQLLITGSRAVDTGL
jgi:hypothetical protein